MADRGHPLTQAEFEDIYGRVPRLTVELVIRTPQGIALSKIPPKYNQGERWYLPGGTVRFGETLTQTVERVAKQELGITVSIKGLLGYIHYQSLLAAGYKGWPVGMAFAMTIAGGELTVTDEGDPIQCFTTIPENTIVEQREFLNKYLAEYPL